MNALKWLWKYVKKYRWVMAATFVLTLLIVVSAFVLPVVVGRIVDNVIIARDTSLLFFYSFLTMSGVLIKDVTFYSRYILVEHISQSVIKEIRNTIYDKLQTLDCSYFDRTRKGDIMSRLTMDTDAIRILISSTLPNILDQIFYIVIGFSIMFSSSVPLALMIIIIAPVIGFFAYKLAKTIKHDFLALRESNANLNTVVSENISGNRVVKAYAREEYEIEKFEKRNTEYKKSFLRHIYTWSKYCPPMTFFVNAVYVVVILVGGYLVLSKKMTVGQFTLFNGCIWCIVGPMANV